MEFKHCVKVYIISYFSQIFILLDMLITKVTTKCIRIITAAYIKSSTTILPIMKDLR